MERISSTYNVIETLSEGQVIQIRAIQPGDRDNLQQAFHQLSGNSIRHRFFNAKRELTPKELSYFTEVDFSNHVALVAELVIGESKRLVGVGRFMRLQDQPGHSEFAITVADDLQGLGIGKLLLYRLIGCARDLGISHLDASMLAQNTGMSKLLQHTGLSMESQIEDGVRNVSLTL